MTVNIDSPGRVPVTVHWELPARVLVRALVGEAQVEIILGPAQARELARLLDEAADRTQP